MEFIERLKTEYGIELNPQQQRAAETVDGPAAGGAGQRQNHCADRAAGKHAAKPWDQAPQDFDHHLFTAVGSGYAGAVCPVFRGGRRAEVFDHSQFLLWGGQTYLDPIPPSASADAS